MARVFELSTHVQSISRGDGRSATAAAAYRACCEIECEREGRTHDYSRKRGLETAEIILPQNAPVWASNRARLWNAAEMREKNGKRQGGFKIKAQVAREFFFSFPAELSQAGRLSAARAIARYLADTHGIAADFAIHQPGREGDERNFHCHMLTTTRRLLAEGLGEKAREWADLKTGAKLAKEMRAFIAQTLNDGLAAEGKAELVHVEHRSFKARGSGQRPQIHQGPGRTNEQRRKQGQARRAWFQRVQQDQGDRQAKELAGLKLRQEFGLQGKLADLHRRGGEQARAIKREMDAARAADRPPQGTRRAFLLVTGRLGREAFDRQARDMRRVAEAKRQLADLKAGLRAERSAYREAQAHERAVLIKRHAAEDRQLSQALDSRQRLDRTVEIQTRRPSNEQSLTQERSRPARSIGRDLGS